MNMETVTASHYWNRGFKHAIQGLFQIPIDDYSSTVADCLEYIEAWESTMNVLGNSCEKHSYEIKEFRRVAHAVDQHWKAKMGCVATTEAK